MRKIPRATLVAGSLVAVFVSGCSTSRPLQSPSQDLVVIESPSGTTVKVAKRISPPVSKADPDDGESAKNDNGKAERMSEAERKYKLALTRHHPLDKIRLGSGDYIDTATTAYGLWSGVAEEANPIFAPFGDAVPAIILPTKYGLKKLAVSSAMTEAEANVGVESFGALGGCANIATVSGAAIGPALVAGAGCMVLYRKAYAASYERATAHRLDGTVIPKAEWIAKYGDD